jgi:hypothetical protein
VFCGIGLYPLFLAVIRDACIMLATRQMNPCPDDFAIANLLLWPLNGKVPSQPQGNRKYCPGCWLPRCWGRLQNPRSAPFSAFGIDFPQSFVSLLSCALMPRSFGCCFPQPNDSALEDNLHCYLPLEPQRLSPRSLGSNSFTTNG